MSRDRRSLAERFIDRFQLWPFYRRCKYNEKTMESIREVQRQIDEGYQPNDDQISHREYGITKGDWQPVGEPKYLEGRQSMAEHGYDMGELDYVISMLSHKDKLPSRYGNHKLKGDMKGYRGCYVDCDRLLVYRYDGKKLILYAIDTVTDEDISC